MGKVTERKDGGEGGDKGDEGEGYEKRGNRKETQGELMSLDG